MNTDLSADVTLWLEELRRRRWSLYFWPTPAAPEMWAAAWRWDCAADVILIKSEQYAVAWRMPVEGPDTDPFAPKTVTWYYVASTDRTLRAALTLAMPGLEQFPYAAIAAPPECRVPANVRGSMTIRPGSDGLQAAVRVT